MESATVNCQRTPLTSEQGEESRACTAGRGPDPRGRPVGSIVLALALVLFGSSITPGLPSSKLTAAGTDRVSQSGRHLPFRPAASGKRLPRAVIIKQGDTLSSISRTYDVPVDAIVGANALRTPDRIWPGQRLIIPAAGSLRGRRSSARRRMGWFLWPARGYVTSRFGWRWRRHHNGIDIAANWGSPIRAAQDGKVSFAGWYRGYGKMIIIDHSRGMNTRYAHASRLRVKAGEFVKAGGVIGTVGCTGFCLGTHLHFEVGINGRPVDPLPYLD